MLFNSLEFLFGFLPLTVFGYLAALHLSAGAARWWLVLASLFFYGWWDPANLPLLLFSMTFNFAFGLVIARERTGGRLRAATVVTTIGIVSNLLLLGYFKYAAFLASIFTGASYQPSTHTIPLGISFFTFTQIAYLADTLAGKARERDPMSYVLFVTWFPHLIAGPLLHHREMMDQFRASLRDSVRSAMIASGATLFAFGLFKKVVLADSVGAYIADTNAASAFVKAANGIDVGLFEAWTAALAYTCQIYFDFSGYSDMALGLSALFGIKLPVNFNSPYKATNISDFWRRWHITLARFLREYVYIPLGGNRRRHFFNLFLTMVIGGIWHGAGWTFVAWGAWHGIALVTHRAWRKLRGENRAPTRAGRFAGWAITFLVVVIGWVFFRSASLSAAVAILAGMAGMKGLVVASAVSQPLAPAWLWIVPLLSIAWLLPNTQEIMRRAPVWLEIAGYYREPAERWLTWRPTLGWSMAASALLVAGVLGLSQPTQFIYFQF
jgi:alginate O-acetyltransferase complex protein AlgI